MCHHKGPWHSRSKLGLGIYFFEEHSGWYSEECLPLPTSPRAPPDTRGRFVYTKPDGSATTGTSYCEPSVRLALSELHHTKEWAPFYHAGDGSLEKLREIVESTQYLYDPISPLLPIALHYVLVFLEKLLERADTSLLCCISAVTFPVQLEQSHGAMSGKLDTIKRLQCPKLLKKKTKKSRATFYDVHKVHMSCKWILCPESGFIPVLSHYVYENIPKPKRTPNVKASREGIHKLYEEASK